MSFEDTLISSLVDGCLPAKQAVQLSARLRQSPALVSHLLDELVISDLLSRELNPARADTLFLAQLDTLLDHVNLSSPELDPRCSDNEAERLIAHKATIPPLRHTWKRSKAMRFILQMAASLVICAGLYWQFVIRPSKLSAPIASIEEPGKGFEVHRGQTVIAASQGMSLRSGDLIVSSKPGQRLAFNFTDGSTVSLFEGTSIRVEDIRSRGKLISLETGKAHFQVSKQENSFRVASQHGTVTVVGTIFDVAANASSMSLAVTEGAVDFKNTLNHQITVRAGEQAIAGRDNPRIRHTITLVATDDASVKSKRLEHQRYGLEKHVLTTTHVENKSRSDFLLKFDLGSIPENIIHASLRLYCTKIEAQAGIITVNAERIDYDKWNEARINWESPPKAEGPILASWSPEAGKYNTIDLSDVILPKLVSQNALSLRFKSTLSVPTEVQGAVMFASRQHPDKDKWPVLILEIGEPK